MKLEYLLQLVVELPQNTTLNYVRGTDTCRFVNVDVEGQRINSEAPTGEAKSWAPTYLQDLAPKIKANVPFNLSGLLNNKGSYRPVLETIIAHTREFHTVRRGTATALVWIPSMPKPTLELHEVSESEIPPALEEEETPIIDKDKLREELKNGFLKYFTNYLRMSTGSCDGQKIQKYLHLYEKNLERPLRAKFPQFNSIFDFQDEVSLNNFLFDAKNENKDLSILLLDKWPSKREDQTFYYEVWTMIRHYRAFLELLKSLNVVVQSIKCKTPALDKQALSTETTSPDYLRAMRTKPFLLLAGISGTGKSRIVKQMAFDSCPDKAVLRQDPTSPGNYCLVEVKPNWHDSTELLGYVSRIGSAHYVLTPFVKFLAKAMLHPDVPFFVCLDEMNLAPVEQYFAEFLSVLESRTKVDGHVVSEPLIKAELFGKLITEAALFDREETMPTDYSGTTTEDQAASYGKEHSVFETLQREGLRIPENVVIVGTVNMDETTHQFSRKVIDRAMTIEMNLPEGEPFKDFFENPADLEYRETPASKDLYLATETKAKDVVSQLAEADSAKTGWLKDEVAKFLTELNAALNGTPFKVAYRVQNELMLYFYQMWRENKDAKWREILTESCDQILMMKVLPRIEGDEELLEKPLEELAKFFAENNFEASSKKVNEMSERLKQSHFASFWP